MAAAAPARRAPREIRLEFTGRAGEYFRIWVVNLALTIVTLGIYSAWAKVRTRRYFYGSLRIEGSPFEYTADPVRILVGRLIVLGFVAAYSIARSLLPPLGIAVAVGLFLATPWIVIRALSFNHRNTRWRNLRFAFRGSYGDAGRVYLGWALLTVVSLGTLAPWAHQKRHAFMVKGSRYGAEPFSFHSRPRDYYGPYIAAFVLVVLGFAATIALITFVAPSPAHPEDADAGAEAGQLFGALAAIPFFLTYFAAFVCVSVGTTNLLYGGAELAGHRFRSELRFGELLALYAVSALAIAASFGLLIPWAQVLLARYRAARLKLLPAGDLDGFVAAAEEAERTGALADEAAVAFAFDFGL